MRHGAGEIKCPAGDGAHGSRQQPVLARQHARGQTLGRVVRFDGDPRLGQQRAGVEVGGDDVDAAAMLRVASARAWGSSPESGSSEDGC